MDFTDNGRYAVGSFALLAAGFALGSLTRIELSMEGALSILGGAAALLLLSARRGRNGNGNGH